MANHLFPTIFESVDEHRFLKIWGHSDLRSQKYAEVAENSLRLIKNVSITKTWFFKLLHVARLMTYPETSNRHQNFSLAHRRPQPQKSGIPTWQPQSFYVKQLCRMSEIALASPKPKKSYFIAWDCSSMSTINLGPSFLGQKC